MPWRTRLHFTAAPPPQGYDVLHLIQLHQDSYKVYSGYLTWSFLHRECAILLLLLFIMYNFLKCLPHFSPKVFTVYVLAIIVDSPWDCKEHKEMVLLDNQSIAVCACSVMSDPLWPRGPDLVDYSLSGSSVHGILQARILEWVAVPSSRGSFRPMSPATLSHCRQIIYHWVTGEAHGTENRQPAKGTGSNLDVWLAPEHSLFNQPAMPAVRGFVPWIPVRKGPLSSQPCCLTSAGTIVSSLPMQWRSLLS